MKRRFGRDYMAKLDDLEKEAIEREKPVYVRDIAGKQILTVLERLVGMWSCHDVRYDGMSSDDDLLTDMIKGMERRVSRRVLSEGVLEYVVEFIKNMDQIERYNAVVRAHNKKWVDSGKPTKIFDPLSGDVSVNRDGYVDPVYTEGGKYKLPDSVYESQASNRLTEARPEVDRKSHIRVKYQISVRADMFVLGFAAYDYSDSVVYYNSLEHKDLAYLVRRSVQEIWGNPKATKHFDPLLVGIPMLIHGDKLALCKMHSAFPMFMATDEAVEFKSTKGIRSMEDAEVMQTHLSNLTGFYLPIVTILGFIFCFFWTVVQVNHAPEILSDEGSGFFGLFLPVMVCILLLISIYVMRFISQRCDRKASEISARRSFS